MTASQLITPALSFAAPLAPPLTPDVTLTTGPIPTSRRSEPFSRHAPCSPGLRALNWLALSPLSLPLFHPPLPGTPCPPQLPGSLTCSACMPSTDRARARAGGREAGGRWVGGAWQGVGTGAACDVR